MTLGGVDASPLTRLKTQFQRTPRHARIPGFKNADAVGVPSVAVPCAQPHVGTVFRIHPNVCCPERRQNVHTHDTPRFPGIQRLPKPTRRRTGQPSVCVVGVNPNSIYTSGSAVDGNRFWAEVGPNRRKRCRLRSRISPILGCLPPTEGVGCLLQTSALLHPPGPAFERLLTARATFEAEVALGFKLNAGFLQVDLISAHQFRPMVRCRRFSLGAKLCSHEGPDQGPKEPACPNFRDSGPPTCRMCVRLRHLLKLRKNPFRVSS